MRGKHTSVALQAEGRVATRWPEMHVTGAAGLCPQRAALPRPTLPLSLSNLWLPTLRGVIERNITAVAMGQRTK